jgi:hypothetical protein
MHPVFFPQFLPQAFEYDEESSHQCFFKMLADGFIKSMVGTRVTYCLLGPAAFTGCTPVT